DPALEALPAPLVGRRSGRLTLAGILGAKHCRIVTFRPPRLSAAALRDSRGDRPARGRVLAQTERVQHLVNDEDLDRRSLSEPRRGETRAAHAHDPVARGGKGQGDAVSPAGCAIVSGDKPDPPGQVLPGQEILERLAQRTPLPIVKVRQDALAFPT